MPKKIIQTLSQTLRRLVGEGQRYPKIQALAARSGVSKSTIARARNAENALRIDNLEDLARAYNLEPWQMLVEGVDPADPPRLNSQSETSSFWPFAGLISKQEYENLPKEAKEAIREFVEMKVRNSRQTFRRETR